VRAQIGIAVNPDLALLAARHATPCLVVENAAIFLADLPLADAAPAPEHAAVLRSWGIYTLGALARLAPAELIARLGPEAGELWQQARGKSERLLRLARQPERLEERFDFEHEIETTEPLLFLLRRFLDSLLRRVQDTGRVVARMTLALPLEDGTACERLFVIPSPTAEIDVLYQTLATYLETLHLDQRPIGVRLTIEPALPANDQLQLFESALRDPNRFGETLARLAALVGNDNIGIPQHTDTHRPDAHRLTSPTFRGGEKPIKADADPSLSIGLPLHRYRPPLPAEVQSVHDTPVFLSSAVARGVIADALGPYRLSGDWWGAEEWAVEEWDVELAAGGLFRLSRAGDAWRVEGCYDGDRLR
jgi:protein ImuB